MSRSECRPRDGTQRLAGSAACARSLSPPRGAAVSGPALPRSTWKPQTGLASPTCRAPPGQ